MWMRLRFRFIGGYNVLVRWTLGWEFESRLEHKEQVEHDIRLLLCSPLTWKPGHSMVLRETSSATSFLHYHVIFIYLPYISSISVFLTSFCSDPINPVITFITKLKSPLDWNIVQLKWANTKTNSSKLYMCCYQISPAKEAPNLSETVFVLLLWVS